MNISFTADIKFFRAIWLALMAGLALTLGIGHGSSMAAIVFVGSVGLYGFCLAEQRRLLMPSWFLINAAALLLAVVLMSALGTTTPDRSWQVTGQMVLIAAGMLLLFATAPYTDTHLLSGKRLATVLLATLAFMIIDLMQGAATLSVLTGKVAGVHDYNRGLSYAAVLIWPVLARLAAEKQTILAVALIALLCLVLTEGDSSAAIMGVGLGAVGGVVAWLAIRLRLWRALVMLTCALLAVALLFYPVLAAWLFAHTHEIFSSLVPSWQHRIEIGDYAAQLVAQNPFGWGAGSFGALEPPPSQSVPYIHTHGPASHPHSAFMQVWVELGVVGVLACLCLLAALAQRIFVYKQSAPAPDAPFVFAAVCAAAALLGTAYNVWTDSLWATLLLAGYLFSTGRASGNLNNS